MRNFLKAAPDTLGCHIGFGGHPDPPVRLCDGADATWTDLDGLSPDRPLPGKGITRLLLLARTPGDLRRAVPLAGVLPDVRAVTVAIAESPGWRPAPVPVLGGGRHWEGLLDLRTRRRPDGSWRIDADFAVRTPAGELLKALSRALSGPVRGETPVVSLAGAGSCHWRPGDPNVVLAPEEGPVPDRREATGCDLLLRTVDAASPLWQDGGVDPVDRPVPGGTLPAGGGSGLPAGGGLGLLAGSGSGGLGGVPPQEGRSQGGRSQGGPQDGRPQDGPQDGQGLPPALRADDLPPVDETSVCPVGFLADTDGPPGELREADGAYEIVRRDRVITRFPASGALTDADVARLRGLPGVVADLGGDRPARTGLAHAVCGLAAAGVPVLTGPDGLGGRWADALGAELAALLEGFDPGELCDPMERELFSIRLRRAALGTHGVAARWRGIAASRGLCPPGPPAVSVLLCTRRPELVGFALEQVARQRGVETEVVLSLHGVPASLPEVREATDAYGGALTVIEEDGRRVFGEVLDRAARRASGALLAKMDDDDWYGPDHLSDLLLARRYSGADLVGVAAEFFYLESLGITVRRHCESELYAGHVAGSSILISREAFDGAGGFRPIPRTVDGQLLESVAAAGGRIYRAHGFNYIVGRRRVAGHTWKEPVNTFLSRYRRQWRGFYANPLMELPGSSPDGESRAADETAMARKGHW
ncbi:glycosyltransferase [Planobispora takensis]|uniref:Glycosyltransferase 2-like domain-containing protein n=1 Tax=Planobispora takensis TaxID=1367882 RepID=A0A8J3T1L8_9ACTN|nr:glycosyltransferase [Planobispora takensis]GII03260.1 hypothetical protein Pta02_52680 [Planobispora takensis]